MINEVLARHNSTSPILNSLGINNVGNIFVEETLRKEYEVFKKNFGELANISDNDKIGRDKDKKYFLFQSGIMQKAWRIFYAESRSWTFKYLDEDFTELMKFLDRVISQKNVSNAPGIRSLISDITIFINDLMPGLYNLKKTYPCEKELVAKIDSIIVTLIDFKDKTRKKILINSMFFRLRTLSE